MDGEGCLPRDLVYDLLTRLPTESILRFRSVCKSWFSIISSPEFIQERRSHFCHPRQNNNTGLLVFPTGIVVKDGPSSSDSLKLWVFPENNPSRNQLIDDQKDTNWFVSGSCNGLFCMTKASGKYLTVFLCNPSVKRILPLPIPSAKFTRTGLYWCSIGFDQVKSDYKVVVIIRGTHFHGKEAWIFSLNSKSWKRAEAPLLNKSIFPGSIFLHGFIHWAFSRPYSSLSIMRFNVSNEVFDEMQLPENLMNQRPHIPISIVKDLLCVTILITGRSMYNYLGCEVWKMKEYGVERSWDKLFRVEFKRSIIQDIKTPTIGGKIVVGSRTGYIARDGKLVNEGYEGEEPAYRAVDKPVQMFSYDPETNSYSNLCREETSRPLVCVEPSLELLSYVMN